METRYQLFPTLILLFKEFFLYGSQEYLDWYEEQQDSFIANFDGSSPTMEAEGILLL